MIFEEFQYRTRGRGRKCYDLVFVVKDRICLGLFTILTKFRRPTQCMETRWTNARKRVTHASQLAEVSILLCIDFVVSRTK